MKLKLEKKNLKNLSQDMQVLPADMTPQVAGGYTAEKCGGGNTDGGGGNMTYGTTLCQTERCGGTTGGDTSPHCAPSEDSVDGCATDTAYPC